MTFFVFFAVFVILFFIRRQFPWDKVC